MNVRELKLAIASGSKSGEIKALNKFFDELFTDIQVITEGDKPDLIFMKGTKCIMKQDLRYGELKCVYNGFWSVLQSTFHCTTAETQEIISYKVEETFKFGSLIPQYIKL